MKVRICATLACETTDEALFLSSIAQTANADLIELRLDHLKELDRVDDIVKATKLPMILTIRRREEGGKFEGNEGERIELFLEMVDKGFEYADIELATPSLQDIVEELKDRKVRVIISHHDLKSTPTLAKMMNIVREELRSGADICKLITKANDIRDNLRCLDLVSKLGKSTEVVCFAMGRLGTPSRILSPLFGSPFTYASIVKGRETAPGQLTVYEMRRIYRTLGITS